MADRVDGRVNICQLVAASFLFQGSNGHQTPSQIGPPKGKKMCYGFWVTPLDVETAIGQ